MSFDCSVCKDDGLCKNSPSHKDYKLNNKDVWVGTDLYDCMDYHDKYIEKKPAGTWMLRRPKRVATIDQLIEYFTDTEEYEKCAELVKIKQDIN